jgi:hypothetical protein
MKRWERPKTPASITAIEENVRTIESLRGNLMRTSQAVLSTFVHAERLRHEAWQEGVPGSNESFVTPVFALEAECDAMIALMNQIKAQAAQIRNEEIQNWGVK